MSFNPYDGQLESASTELEHAIRQRDDVAGRLEWYRSFPADRKTAELSQLEDELARLRAQEQAASDREASLRLVEQRLGRQAHVPPLKLFMSRVPLVGKPLSPEQQAARAAHAKCVEDLEAARRTKAVAQGAVSATAANAKLLSAEIKRHALFDPEGEQEKLDDLLPQIELLEQQCRDLRAAKAALDVKLEPLVRELRKCEQDRDRLEEDVQAAARFDQRLSNAPNSYEKARIHEECSRRFGESKPRRVKEAKQRELAGAARTYDKLQERIRAVAARATREITLLVIDGNNLCYELGCPRFPGHSRLLQSRGV